MNKKIKILPEEIISKIAAGEVIERPASVVKELIENSIDASAKKISVILQKSGKDLIVVKDDGNGIEKDDIPSLFQRHATSKIERFEDLFHITSMGFRGEALYSIASVAEVFLRSKTKEEEIGWEIHVKNRIKTGPKPVAMQTGTEVEVYHLFSNLPARRKFLKSDIMELRKIIDMFIPYAILHPEISFFLVHNKKTIFELLPEKNELLRMSKIFNISQEHLMEFSWKMFDNSVSIKGVFGNINVQRPTKNIQFIFINNRPVQHNGISYTVNSIYKNFFPPESYPAFALFINLKKENVDINVHPSKREVKIKNEAEILNAIRVILEENLFKKTEPKVIAFKEENTKQSVHTSEKEEKYQTTFTQDSIFEQKAEIPEEKTNFKELFLQSKYVATVFQTYLIFELRDSLFIVDQHAAHERIVFERLINQANRGKIKTEQLLIPVSLSLSTQEMMLWESGGKIKLEEIGFQTTKWENRTIAIHSCPEGIKNPEKSVRNILSLGTMNLDIETLLKKACRGSTMAGEIISEQEADSLKNELMTCKQPLTCPHGRPTIIEIEKRFLEKQFMR